MTKTGRMTGLEWLKDQGACQEALVRFRKLRGRPIEEALDAATDDDLCWLLGTLGLHDKYCPLYDEDRVRPQTIAAIRPRAYAVLGYPPPKGGE